MWSSCTRSRSAPLRERELFFGVPRLDRSGRTASSLETRLDLGEACFGTALVRAAAEVPEMAIAPTVAPPTVIGMPPGRAAPRSAIELLKAASALALAAGFTGG